jgi:PKD repeat protein
LVPVIVNPLPTASFTFNANVGGVVTFTNTSTDYVSSQWNFGDNTAWSNNTNPTHTYLEDGVYTVTLTVFNDCGSITINQVVTVLGTGVEELPEGQSLSIAPNPSNGQFALTFSSTTNQNVNISLLNVNGQVIAEDYLGNVSGSVKRAYDYSQLSKGVYMIRIVTNENVITRRIILE